METAEVLDRSLEYIRAHVPEDYPKEVISYSSLKEMKTCSQRWKLRYIDGERPRRSINMIIGSAVHFGIETHYLGGEAVPLANQHLLDHWDHGDEKADSEALSRALTVVQRVVQTYVQEYPATSHTGLELKTSAEIGSGINLIAVTDLLQDESIIDHKTNKGKKFKPDPLQLACNALTLHANGYAVHRGEIRRIRKDILGKTKASPIITPYPYRIDAEFMREHVAEIVRRMDEIAMRTRLELWAGPPAEMNEGHRYCEYACSVERCPLYDRGPVHPAG